MKDNATDEEQSRPSSAVSIFELYTYKESRLPALHFLCHFVKVRARPTSTTLAFEHAQKGMQACVESGAGGDPPTFSLATPN